MLWAAPSEKTVLVKLSPESLPLPVRLTRTTVVPSGAVSSTLRSPSKVWVIWSSETVRPLTAPAVGTLIVDVTPAVLLSGIVLGTSALLYAPDEAGGGGGAAAGGSPPAARGALSRVGGAGNPEVPGARCG